MVNVVHLENEDPLELRVLLERLEFPERMVHRESADHRVLQDQLDQLDQGVIEVVQANLDQ